MKYLLSFLLAFIFSSLQANPLFEDKTYYNFTKDLSATMPFEAKAVSPEGLTKEQARKLLLIMLIHEKYHLNNPDLFIEGPIVSKENKPLIPDYYSFSLGDASTKAGAITYLGLYAVNLKTGDIWEINQCKHYDFPELRQNQAKIMQKTGMSIKYNKVLSSEELGCSQ